MALDPRDVYEFEMSHETGSSKNKLKVTTKFKASLPLHFLPVLRPPPPRWRALAAAAACHCCPLLRRHRRRASAAGRAQVRADQGARARCVVRARSRRGGFVRD